MAILNINNIDQSAVSSKTLVENSPILSNYKLTNIDWVLDNSNDINASDKEINLLEKLLSIRTLEDKGSLAGYIPKAAALTGKIIVDAGAYDSSESIDIYNKYVDNDVYPNLDIDFEGSNADLYSISILNGDGTVYWTKRISQNNNGYDATFLEDGPNGAFNFQDIVKPDTADKVYEFQNQWKVYSADGVSYGTIQGQIPIYNSTIGTDLIFEIKDDNLAENPEVAAPTVSGLNQLLRILEGHTTSKVSLSFDDSINATYVYQVTLPTYKDKAGNVSEAVVITITLGRDTYNLVPLYKLNDIIFLYFL